MYLCRSDSFPDVIAVSWHRFLEEGLEPGKSHLDGIEIRRIGRQKAQTGSIASLWRGARQLVCGRAGYL